MITPETCPTCEKRYKIITTNTANPLFTGLDPLTAPESPEFDAGTPIYDSMKHKLDLTDEFFELTTPKTPKPSDFAPKTKEK